MSFLRDDDAVSIAPDFHTVIFENEVIRVLRVIVPVQGKAGMHWHPLNTNYVLSGGELKITKPDGTESYADLKAGQVTFGEAG